MGTFHISDFPTGTPLTPPHASFLCDLLPVIPQYLNLLGPKMSSTAAWKRDGPYYHLFWAICHCQDHITAVSFPAKPSGEMQLLQHRFYSSPALADAALGLLSSYCEYYHDQHVTKQHRQRQQASGGKQKQQQQGKGSSKKGGKKGGKKDQSAASSSSSCSSGGASSSSISTADVAAASTFGELLLPADHTSTAAAVAGGAAAVQCHLLKIKESWISHSCQDPPDVASLLVNAFTSGGTIQQKLKAAASVKEAVQVDAHYNAHFRCLESHLRRRACRSAHVQLSDFQALAPGHPELSTLLPASATSLSLILEGIALTASERGAGAVGEGVNLLRMALYAANDATRREFLASRGALLLQVLWLVCKECAEKLQRGEGRKGEQEGLLQIIEGCSQVHIRLTCGQDGYRNLGECCNLLSLGKYCSITAVIPSFAGCMSLGNEVA